ncbi:Asp-tRNA(Asn)/Glu-tRNA(Gln) amidotransferase GatCAB subunit C [Candidatus Nomurabacteria bacterium CG_4_9_14_0_2_um_filter_32_10]|uniref:Asp-tRNA(Asn)/Glu-tRNA(Gln) amidotransferase GatCAB subunit C n=3 Tax=Candidatus Nomuraibacteriota TaxID=1752729 RepID=A0A2H0CFR4_9BACT|nr:MAG: Asp-tRNA(Asn)/Glu-tRNA(Gln) amidotransferase GatCAB subunit C [Candidatus Nomurabacteria bacterium CG22_combo_CG10-13_8_21_14_all_32_8]PIZ86285.1 MAG: Asp-tRNA(Asn)/Glu-tRNA(Gln) amidotransferase GatCAB subunit C [Candidatus Nomurabacteria bacterium CG_4_10_14_0_2_um_filter_33_9]PJC49666.1 MAG: Asp-tRNA(Asn)/Glu-tRNA(Gln) amidotransferase GatCAB subunit C [Candidatus Nomurabacteria bacterium CG_4_9_14_0_2_um_filter_32_10]
MNIKDVENLAELAKIDLNEDEKEQILKDMEGILGYVKIIESVETPTIVGVPTGVGINVWREDEVKPSIFSKDLILKQFPDSQDGFLKVKKIL